VKNTLFSNKGYINSFFENPIRVLAFITHYLKTSFRYLICFIHFRVPSAQIFFIPNSVFEFTNLISESCNSITGFINSGNCYHNALYELTEAIYSLHKLWVCLLFSDDSLLQSDEGFLRLSYSDQKLNVGLPGLVLGLLKSTYSFTHLI